MTDTTRTKFVTIAQKRMNRAIKAIREVGELGGRKGVLAVSDVNEINAELKTEVENARARLMAGVAFEPDFRLGTQGEE